MLKKTTLAALAAAVVLTVSGTSFANPGSGMHHRGGDNHGYISYKMEQMTPDQKETWKNWKTKNVELKKQIISKSATWGWITPEQAKERIDRLNVWAASDQPMHKTEGEKGHKDGDLKTKNHPQKGEKQTKEEMQQKRMEFQASMTEEQKAQLKEWRVQKIQLRKEWVSQQYNWGWITKDQADYQTQQLDKRAEQEPFQRHNTKQQRTEKSMKH